MDLVKLLEGHENAERCALLKAELTRRGIAFDIHQYTQDEPANKGENIILTHGSGEKRIIITSHHDAVRYGIRIVPGANDNASGVAVCVDLCERLQRDYASPKNKIQIILFGDEEPGSAGKDSVLHGSMQYVKETDLKNILAVYSLECCGLGDMVAIFPVIARQSDIYSYEGEKRKRIFDKTKNRHTDGFRALVEAINSRGYEHGSVGYITRLYSDDLSFRLNGIKESFCIAAVPKKELKLLKEFVKSPTDSLATLLLAVSTAFFKRYHTLADVSAGLSEDSLKMMSDVIYGAVVKLDSKRA